MKTAGRIILWTTCTILFLLTALSIIVPVILSPKRLTPIINNYAGRIPGADIRVSRASVSLFRHFPHATIVLDSGEVIVPSFRDIYPGADSLFVFDRLEAALLPIPLLKGSVSISYLILSHASLNLFRSRDSLSNWNLFNSNPDDTSSIDFWLDIKKLHINDGSEFTFHNAADTVYYNTRITDMMLTARHFSSLFDTRLETTSNTLVVGQTSFFNDIPFNVYGRTGFGIKPQKGNVSLDFEEYLFDECHTILGNVPVFIDGFMGLRDDSLDLRARCRVDSCNMSDLLNVIPGDLVPLKTELVADMPLTLDIVLDGAYYYGQENIPAFSA
ncbi:MAG TPA: AsmA family protein, partial [Bacteroidales bacterium]|nr:AsmA family protein [Bacteroidales bacterium]